MHYSNVHRRGAAPIELVMSIPVIILLCAVMWTLAFSGIDRCWVLTEARNGPWKSRDNPAANKGRATALTWKHSSPLQLAGMLQVQQGQLTGESHRTVNSPAMFGARRKTIAGSAFLAGTWDHRQAPFNGSKLPHFSVLRQMAAGEPGQVEQLEEIGKLLSFSASSNADVANAIQEGGNMQDGLQQLKVEKLKEKLKEYAEAIKKLSKDLLDLENKLKDVKNIKDPLKRLREVRKVRDDIRDTTKMLNAYQQGVRDAQAALHS